MLASVAAAAVLLADSGPDSGRWSLLPAGYETSSLYLYVEVQSIVGPIRAREIKLLIVLPVTESGVSAATASLIIDCSADTVRVSETGTYDFSGAQLTSDTRDEGPQRIVPATPKAQAADVACGRSARDGNSVTFASAISAVAN